MSVIGILLAIGLSTLTSEFAISSLTDLEDTMTPHEYSLTVAAASTTALGIGTWVLVK